MTTWQRPGGHFYFENPLVFVIAPDAHYGYDRGMEDLRVSALIIAPPGRWRSSLCVLLQANPEIGAVQQADDGLAGLRYITQAQPLIVLLDGGLPGDECWLTLKHIKRAWPEVRCVILAHDSAEEQRALTSAADAVLQVGFSGEALYTTVSSLLNLSSSHS